VTIAPLPPTGTLQDPERADRVTALRAAMAVRGLAAVALTSPENVYYLLGLDHLGYFAFTMLVLPAEGDPVLVTREMERTTVLAQVPRAHHVTFADGEDPADAAARAIGHVAPGGGTVGAGVLVGGTAVGVAVGVLVRVAVGAGESPPPPPGWLVAVGGTAVAVGGTLVAVGRAAPGMNTTSTQ
jgi:hypothetical protein